MSSTRESVFDTGHQSILSDYTTVREWPDYPVLDPSVEQLSSSPKVESSGKVRLTYKFRIDPSKRSQSELRNYISEAQTIRRHAANVIYSFDPGMYGGNNHVYNVIKDTYKGKSNINSANRQDNMNKVGEAFLAWESNGYREQGAERPNYGSKPYLCVRGNRLSLWADDGITVRIGGVAGEAPDPGRSEDFDFRLDGGQHQLKVLPAIRDGAVSMGRSEIHDTDSGWTFNLSVAYEQPVYHYNDLDRWIGVDLGTKALYTAAVVEAVDESPKGNGIDVLETEQGPGDELMATRKKQQQTLAHLQHEHGYAVASERLGKRLSRHAEQIEHEYANEIVNLAEDHSPCGIVLEDLIGIKGLGWSNLWAYFRFKETIAYKAHQRGIPVLTLSKVDTRGTSQTCSVCGHNPHWNPDESVETVPEKEGICGRISRDQYRCGECGYGPDDADVNAAINIANRFIEVVLDR